MTSMISCNTQIHTNIHTYYSFVSSHYSYAACYCKYLITLLKRNLVLNCLHHRHTEKSRKRDKQRGREWVKDWPLLLCLALTSLKLLQIWLWPQCNYTWKNIAHSWCWLIAFPSVHQSFICRMLTVYTSKW